ncbi:MAG: hypothetical protein LBI85_02545 [Spirochaetaceae bacterium]|jgi:hypothetical protein|nr:hypothetical protein [Spirochaetaceae bacterium]
MENQTWIKVIKSVSGLFRAVFASPPGIMLLLTVLFLFLVIWLSLAVRRHALLVKAAGKRFSAGAAFSAALEALFRLAGRLVVHLPVLLFTTLIFLSIAGLGSAIAGIEETQAALRRVKELSLLVRNLERSIKVADVEILSYRNGVTVLALDFFDPSKGGGAVERKELSIAGRDIYIDAMILNFDYSEIGQGRRVNLAIPYRVFSEAIPQAEGIPLGAADLLGIPYIFNRSDTDIYGLAPDVYRRRLMEFVELVRDEKAAREEGIVRSVYGSAVHRRTNPGDRFEIRVEQTGGITLRDRPVF